MIGFRPTPFSDEQLLLSRCTGTLYNEGDTIDCGSECLAHFDANTDAREHYEETGECYNPYPNSVLSMVAYLPGTDDVSTLIVPPAVQGSDIHVYRNSGFFFDETGAPMTVFIVVRAACDPDRHFAAAYRDPQAVGVFLSDAPIDTDED